MVRKMDLREKNENRAFANRKKPDSWKEQEGE